MDFQRQNHTLKQLLAARISRIDTLNKKTDNYVFPRTHYFSKPFNNQSHNSNFRQSSQDSISISSISQVYNLNDQNTSNLFQSINYSHNNRFKDDPRIAQGQLHFEQLCQIRLEPLLKNWSQEKKDRRFYGKEGQDNPEKKNRSVEKSIKIKLCSNKHPQPNNPINLHHFSNTASSPAPQLQDLSQQKMEGCFDILKSGLWNLFDNPNTESNNQKIKKNNQSQLFSQRKKQIVKHRKIKSIFNKQLSTSELKHHRSISTNIHPTTNNSKQLTEVQPKIKTQNYRSKSAFCQKGFSEEKQYTRKIKILEFRY